MEGHIYIWFCNDSPDLFYVGGTIDIRERMIKHKSDYNKNKEIKLYTIARENGGYDNFTYEVVDTHACETKKDLRIHEQLWIDKLQPSMNSKKAHKTQEQTKKELKEYHKKYHEKKSEERKKKINCECGVQYSRACQSRHFRSPHHIRWNEKKIEIVYTE